MTQPHIVPHLRSKLPETRPSHSENIEKVLFPVFDKVLFHVFDKVLFHAFCMEFFVSVLIVVQ